MIDLLKDVGKGILGEVAGGFFNGKSGGGGGGGQTNAASAAALARIGFAEEKRVAMQMAENAAKRSGQRLHSEKERRAQRTSQDWDRIVGMYQKAFQDSRVFDALSHQVNRQGNAVNVAASTDYINIDADLQLDPQKITPS